MRDDLPLWLWDAMHDLIFDRERPLQELLAAYDALEERAVRVLNGKLERPLRIEAKRRLASLRLGAAMERACSAKEGRKLFDRCEQLGYSAAWKRLTVAAILRAFVWPTVIPNSNVAS